MINNVVGDKKKAIYQVLQDNPDGLTIDEVESMTGVLYRTISSHVHGLVREGIVKFTGEMRTGNEGRRIRVWALTGKSPKPPQRGRRPKRPTITIEVVPESTLENEVAVVVPEDIPMNHRSFWDDIRSRITVWASRFERHVDEGRFQQLLGDFEADVREAVQTFGRAVSRAREVPTGPISRKRLMDACHTLNMSPPKVNAPVDMKKAKNQKKKMVRVYHVDVTGNESTRAAFEAVVAAYDVCEQYNQQLKGILTNAI